MEIDHFQQLLQEKGQELFRQMPWRDDTQPYYILVSELMLQQTQVERVIPKFIDFIARFPDLQTLASAPLGDVLILWSGLGYNRRAKYLHESAKKIMREFGGIFPDQYAAILSLPGVGQSTAGALMTYAYNQPVVFIETNVRTVYFHHFFADGEKVSDEQLKTLVAETIDAVEPRAFYWALMDYGSWLKKQGVGRIKQSQHYTKQSPLKGSVREVRGQIVRALTEGELSVAELGATYADDTRFTSALSGLIADGLVVQSAEILHLTK